MKQIYIVVRDHVPESAHEDLRRAQEVASNLKLLSDFPLISIVQVDLEEK